MNTKKTWLYCILSAFIGGFVSGAVVLLLSRNLAMPINASEFNVIDENGNYLASLKSAMSENESAEITALTFYDKKQKSISVFGVKDQKPLIGLLDSNNKSKFSLNLDENGFANMFFYGDSKQPTLSIGVLDSTSQGIFLSGENGEGRLILGNFNNEVGIELYKSNGTVFWRKTEY